MATWAMAPEGAWRTLMRRDSGRGRDAGASGNRDSSGSHASDPWNDPDDGWPHGRDAWSRPGARTQAPGTQRQRDLPPTQPVRSPESRRTIVIALACLGSALVIVLALILVSLPSGAPSPTGSTSATIITSTGATAIPTSFAPTDTPNPKSFTPTPLPAPGWHNAGPSFAESIAFTPSDAQTAYACGANAGGTSANAHGVPNSSPEPTMTLAVSHDGGATWQNVFAPFTGVHCSLSVSPTNANDVVISDDEIGSGCSPCGGIAVYLSTDGGAHVTQLVLPPEAPNVIPPIGAITWVGTHLYATVAPSGSEMPPHQLAVSNNGGAFQWVNESGLPKANGKAPLLSTIVGDGPALAAIANYANCAACTEIVLSMNGVTWQSIPFADVAYLWAGTDGKTLLAAQAGISQIDVSKDFGMTFHTVPTPNVIPTPDDDILLAPDGTIYGAFDGLRGFNTGGIFRLSPGSTQWALAAAYPAARTLLGVQWDGAGHPLALWGQATFNYTAGMIGPGLQRHAP
jgi:hypothetical protein